MEFVEGRAEGLVPWRQPWQVPTQHTVLLDAKGDVPCAPGRLVVVMSMVVVVVVAQGWYREHLVGRRRHGGTRERGLGGSGEGGGRERGGLQYDIINCSTMPPACKHEGGHEEPGAFLWSRPIARPSYGGNFIKWILIDAVLRLTI